MQASVAATLSLSWGHLSLERHVQTLASEPLLMQASAIAALL
jgi:hypothetical protein